MYADVRKDLLEELGDRSVNSMPCTGAWDASKSSGKATSMRVPRIRLPVS